MAGSSRRLTLVRALLLALAALSLAAACAQLARAGEAPVAASVAVAPSDGGEPRSLALADLAAQSDVHDAQYVLRAADGTTSTLTVASGISLEALVRAAGLDGDAFTHVELTRPDGTAVFVVREQIAVGEGGPPVVWSDEQGVHFLRPSTGTGDANAGDHLLLAGGAALQVTLRTGDPLAPRISASSLRAQPNEAIDFSASLAVGTLGPGMEYSWYFDDRRSARGANVTHRFRRAGRYTILLNIVRGSEALGSPAVLVVRIVRPEGEREDDDGARRSRERGRDGGSGGSGDPGGTGAGGTDGGAGGGGSGGGSGGGVDTPAPSPPSVPPVPAAAPPAPPPPAPAPPPQRPRRRPQPAAEPQGEQVSGTLLAAADGAFIPPAGGASAAAGGADDPLHVPVGVWVAIGLAALLALGWTLESRHTLPFWQP